MEENAQKFLEKTERACRSGKEAKKVYLMFRRSMTFFADMELSAEQMEKDF